MINDPRITPSPDWDRGNGPETQPGIEPKGNVIPNLPALAGTLALQGGEEVSSRGKSRYRVKQRVLCY
jgi:hypothetical protein